MKTTTTKAISAANIAALAAIVDAANKTGEIEAGALDRVNRSIERHATINGIAAYLRGKELTADEKRKVSRLVKSIETKDEAGQRLAKGDLTRMADPFYRGDMVQLLSRLAPFGQSVLSRMEAFAIERASLEVNSPDVGDLETRTRSLKECADRLKVGGDLATIRADKPKRKGPRTVLDLNTMRVSEIAA
ncbi:hypothetical protein [Agrobacterium tumefaciens]|uniref:hypothetical protein n=1 Tax=Agrobacterium tumefaciens TaxID=358 RepID=UPI0015720BB5|nr:hypothetical protein [Agrobacterium tumefaciens]